MNIRSAFFHGHRTPTFVSLAFFSTAIKGFTDQNAVWGIISLAILLVYSRLLFPGLHAVRDAAILWAALTIAAALPLLSASTEALSTPSISILVLLLSAAVISSFVVAILFVDTRFCTKLYSFSQIALFPALWATGWLAVAQIDPVGRLSTWSPGADVALYRWMVPFVGVSVNDWVTASWAVVAAQFIGIWFIGGTDEELLVDHPEESSSKLSTPRDSIRHATLLALILTLLTIPSSFSNILPLPTISEDTTPISLGCALPFYQKYHHHTPTLDDYIKESTTLASLASIILWPEGAVRFGSVQERDAGLERVRHAVIRSAVGVSFEEEIANPNDPSGKASLKRMGLAMVSNASVTPHLLYFKRNLVPIAESFSLSRSEIPPSISVYNLSKPTWVTKPEWGPAPHYTRPIPLTASICLDFATLDPFAELDSRPALILAPARTWHPSVGVAMWRQAQQRAEELGSTVLWCDGGEGGVSGVGSQNHREFMQVGQGSWVRTVALKYPFDGRKTVYASLGRLSLVSFWLLVLAGFAGQRLPIYGLSEVRESSARMVGSAWNAIGSLRKRNAGEQVHSQPDLLG